MPKNVAIFGIGPQATVLVPLLRENGFHIEAIWGRTMLEAEEQAEQLKIPLGTNKIDELLLRKNIDLVFIICPPYFHSQISVKALGIGKHVVCADSIQGLEQRDILKMVQMSQYYPSLIALVNHNLRFLPAVVRLRKEILEGSTFLGQRRGGAASAVSVIDVRVQVGSLLQDRYNWRCDDTMGGGVLNLVGSHIIDLVTFVTGRRATRVHGLIRSNVQTTPHVNGIRQITAPDFSTFQMELEGAANGNGGGASASLETSGPTIVTVTLHSHQNTTTTFVHEIMVFGADGYLALRGMDLFGHSSTSKNPAEEVLYVDGSPDAGSGARSFEHLLQKGQQKMVFALREAFLPGATNNTGWIKSPVETAAKFDDGIYVAAVLDAIKRSNADRSWIKVNVLSESPTNNNQTKILNAVRMSAVALN